MGNKLPKNSGTEQTKGSGDSADQKKASDPSFRILVLGDQSTGKSSVIKLTFEALESLLAEEPENSREIDGFATPPAPDAVATVGIVDTAHGRSFIALYVGDNNSRESIDNCKKRKWIAESRFKDIEASRMDFDKAESFLLINKVAEGSRPIVPFSEQETMKVSWKLDSVLLLNQLDPLSQGIIRIAERMLRQLQRLAVAPIIDDFCED